METAKTFEDLLVWQKAHQFVLGIYEYSKNFPREEIYGLTSQFRRASISVAANIAEGFKKRGKRDKARFLNIAQGSLEECRYYLVLSGDLNFGENHHLKYLLEEVSRMLSAYHKAVINSINQFLWQNIIFKLSTWSFKQWNWRFCSAPLFLRGKNIVYRRDKKLERESINENRIE